MNKERVALLLSNYLSDHRLKILEENKRGKRIDDVSLLFIPRIQYANKTVKKNVAGRLLGFNVVVTE